MNNLDYIVLDDDALEVDESTGFLKVMANLTRTGIFTYFEKMPDGTVRIIRQLREPDEVFAEQSLKSLMGLPATNQHPEELVNPENSNDYVVGMTSDQPKRIYLPQGDDVKDKEEYIQQLVSFFDKDTIGDIKNGNKREMSLGYQCWLDETSGEWNGQQYDCIQRDIRYNHLALVEKGRAGPMARILTDAKEEAKIHTICDGLIINDDTENNNMRVFIHDGKELKVSDDIHDVLTAFQKNCDDKQSNLDSQRLEIDKLNAKLDDYTETEKDKKTQLDAEKFNKAVAARVALETKAATILDNGTKLEGLTDIEVKKLVIKKLRPDTNLDDKSEAYIDARYDVAVEDNKEPTTKIKLEKSMLKDGQTETYEEKRKRKMEEQRNAWKKPIMG